MKLFTVIALAIALSLIISSDIFASNKTNQKETHTNASNKINYLSESSIVINYKQQPQKLQLFPRDNQDSSNVTFAGDVLTSGFDSVYIEVYKNNVLWKRKSKKLIYSLGISPFSVSQKIHAELCEYKFILYAKLSAVSTLLKSVDSVVCGDAFIICGQSNSNPTNLFSTYKNEYCRTFGVQTAYYNETVYNAADTNWAMSTADGLNRDTQPITSVGVWGLQLQKLIKENFGIPSCIINGGRGGSLVEDNLRNNSNQTDFNSIYGKTLYRTIKSGLANNIKAIFWHQGESNGNSTYLTYNNNFTTLYNSWKENYPGFRKIFMFQVRPTYCSYDNSSQLREVQRKLPQTIPELELMSTVALPDYDGCHYFYYGYINMGDVIFKPVSKNFYTISDTVDIKPPNIKYAYYTTPTKNKISLMFENSRVAGWPSDTLGQNMKNYFYLNGFNGNVSTGSVSGDTLKLSLTAPSSATKLTYLPAIYNFNNSEVFEGPFLKNSKKVGALSFHDFPISNYAPVTLNVTMAFYGLFNSTTGIQNIDESVNILLRDNFYPFAVRDSASASVDSVTLTGKFIFSKLPAGTYYIVVKGRNILETWSKTGGVIIAAGSTVNYNFTTVASQAYGNNMIRKGTKYCLYNSDLTQDGVIEGMDYLRVVNDAYSLTMGHVLSDLNGDNFVDGSDVSISDFNSTFYLTKITP
ncbi:MAG: sialate O-acetylesterase [Ignavibacteria bacterium]